MGLYVDKKNSNTLEKRIAQPLQYLKTYKTYKTYCVR